MGRNEGALLIDRAEAVNTCRRHRYLGLVTLVIQPVAHRSVHAMAIVMTRKSPAMKPVMLPALLAILLPACTSSGDFPSLARRDAERIKGTADPVAAEPSPSESPPSPPGAALAARLERLVDQARDAHRRFAERQPRGEQMVAAGRASAPGSEAWALATIALADLEGARSEAMIALADLDQIYAAEQIGSTETTGSAPQTASGDGLAIAAARDQVVALVAEEDAVLAALKARSGR